MNPWKIAGIQIDCQLGNPAANRTALALRLREAASRGAKLAVFPECAVTGYAFDSRDEALPVAEPIPGPTTEVFGSLCRELNVWAVIGLLERDGDRMFNAAVLVGPQGLAGSYRKIHLPFLGVDRFTTPGDRPFAVHDCDGLRVGMSICYDGSFPETTRILMLQGADLVVLPTNWPVGAEATLRHLVQCRALENHVYYAAVNRVGTERQTRYIGQSRIVNVNGDLLASAGENEEALILAEIDPERARNKQIVRIPGKYMLHRVNDRRPEMYEPIAKPMKG
jgi:predicted amidohydrolase